ncbi:MAG: hypothetical protein N2322_03915, partial [Terrimicrobiaceae bacterium]|nr:hypothetical protein [Terrimicrobiaceae bacterium]
NRTWQGKGFGYVSGGGGLLAPCGEDSFDAGDVAAEHAQHVWALELAGLLLNAQIEHLMAEVTLACLQLLNGQILKFRDFHGGSSACGSPGSFSQNLAAVRRPRDVAG